MVQQARRIFKAEEIEQGGINDGLFRTLAKSVLTKKRKAKKEGNVQIPQV